MAGKASKQRAQKRRADKVRLTPTIYQDIHIQDVPATIGTFQGIIAAFGRGELDRATYTGLVYGLNCFTGLLRLSLELEMEARLRRIEEAIQKLPEVRS
ncbi:MAG: hypothetical protein EHM28_01025 [Spirochaetaceae bacterium]|nr:MAG: hypothetical protein EHM28_01025 [Spirochaetaceae bacterium]